MPAAAPATAGDHSPRRGGFTRALPQDARRSSGLFVALAEAALRAGRRRGRKMAWVLKMDEVIESGLVHDFDASLTGIGQELGAGAYSMRYRTPWAGRAGGRTDRRTHARLRTLGKGLQDPGPLPDAAALSGAPGLPGLGSRPAARPPGPCSLAGLCPRGWRAWGCSLRPRNRCGEGGSLLL